MFPAAGWEAIAPDEQPVQRQLPLIARAYYYDPSRLNGIGTMIEAETLDRGRSEVVVRARASVVEAEFTQRDTWGVALLDSFEALFGATCTLLLTVYDDDQTTELFSVSSDPEHPRPYLVEPDNYGEQELDVAAGRASLTTVQVTVIDPARTPGDQDSGYMTSKLARVGIPDLAGHRCRLVRFTAEGPVIVIDGPAGPVSLDKSYAAYTWEIRDTRDTERKVRCFDLTPETSLLPDELLPGYGYDPASDTYLVEPAKPLQGHFHAGVVAWYGKFSVGASEFPEQLRRLLISSAARDAVIDGIARRGFGGAGKYGDQPVTAPWAFALRWRLSGSTDEWTELRGAYLEITLSTAHALDSEGQYILGDVFFQDRRLNPTDALYDPDAPPLPDDNDIVEFMVLGTQPPDDLHPVVLEAIPFPEGAGLLNMANTPVLGRFELDGSAGGISEGTIDLTAVPGNAEVSRRQRIAILESLANLGTGDTFTPIGGLFRWRAAGSSDPWTEIPIEPAVAGGASVSLTMVTPFTYLYRIFETLVLTAPDALVPADAQDIEFTLTLVPPEPLTAGQLAINVYDALYSLRDENGNVVPTPIRYDEDALLVLTDLVRLRLTEPIEDARAWLEEHIFAPLGWVPALDSLARISPVSQVAPSDTSDLDVVENANAEPSPDWDTGQRIINVLRFIYPRDYSLAAPDEDEIFKAVDAGSYNDAQLALATEQRQKRVESQEVIIEYEDPISVSRHGRVELELAGDAFRAIGKLV